MTSPKLTGNTADNTRCGSVAFDGSRLSGCGAHGVTYEVREDLPGFPGLWTHSHYCAACLPRYTRRLSLVRGGRAAAEPKQRSTATLKIVVD